MPRVSETESTGKEKRVRELEQRIEELKSRWPKHSIPPAMLEELDELEEELERLRGA